MDQQKPYQPNQLLLRQEPIFGEVWETKAEQVGKVMSKEPVCPLDCAGFFFGGGGFFTTRDEWKQSLFMDSLWTPPGDADFYI